jgi:hypothetical protein
MLKRSMAGAQKIAVEQDFRVITVVLVQLSHFSIIAFLPIEFEPANCISPADPEG